MNKEAERAFTNHKYNGVFLSFPNGNAISTVWGKGTYSDNQHWKDDDWSVSVFKELIKHGSNEVEIMLFTDDSRLQRRIFRKCDTNIDNGVIGRVDITTWLWVINQLAKERGNVKN